MTGRPDWWRWYDHPLARPFDLARFSFLRKYWHPRPRRLARLRHLYWVLLRHHETETCGRCGGPVRIVFHVPDYLWAAVSGFERAERSPGGEACSGVLCPYCFDDLALEADLPFLRWTCSLDDSVLRG